MTNKLSVSKYVFVEVNVFNKFNPIYEIFSKRQGLLFKSGVYLHELLLSPLYSWSNIL